MKQPSGINEQSYSWGQKLFQLVEFTYRMQFWPINFSFVLEPVYMQGHKEREAGGLPPTSNCI